MPLPLLAIGSLAASVGSSIFGSSQAAKAAREAQREQQRQRAARDAQIRLLENRSEADTARGQNIIRMAKEAGDDAVKEARGAAAVGGATDAATAQAKEARNKMVAEAVAQLAAGDTARQDRAAQMKIQAAESDAAADVALAQQKAQSQMQLAAGVSDALAGAAGHFMGAQGSTAVKPSATIKPDKANWTLKGVEQVSSAMNKLGAYKPTQVGKLDLTKLQYPYLNRQ